MAHHQDLILEILLLRLIKCCIYKVISNGHFSNCIIRSFGMLRIERFYSSEPNILCVIPSFYYYHMVHPRCGIFYIPIIQVLYTSCGGIPLSSYLGILCPLQHSTRAAFYVCLEFKNPLSPRTSLQLPTPLSIRPGNIFTSREWSTSKPLLRQSPLYCRENFTTIGIPSIALHLLRF